MHLTMKTQRRAMIQNNTHNYYPKITKGNELAQPRIFCAIAQHVIWKLPHSLP